MEKQNIENMFTCTLLKIIWKENKNEKKKNNKRLEYFKKI